MTVQEMDYLSTQVLFEEDPRVCITDSYGESCFGSYTSEMGTLWFAAILIENGNETYYTVYYGNDQDIQVVWEKHITTNHESLEYHCSPGSYACALFTLVHIFAFATQLINHIAESG